MENTTMTTFTLKGQTFESPYTDKQVYDKLKALADDGNLKSNFGVSLVNGYSQYGQFTPGQQPWAHKILLDATQKQSIPMIPGFTGIVDHLTNCRKRRDEGGVGLLNPKAYVARGDCSALFKYSSNPKRNGYLSVASKPGFGNVFYGWIDPQGKFERRDACTDEQLEFMKLISSDPDRLILEIGKEMGHCCYCFATLSQVQSKIAGCGSTCARNYEIWYPNATETRAYLVHQPDVLRGATDADRWS